MRRFLWLVAILGSAAPAAGCAWSEVLLSPLSYFGSDAYSVTDRQYNYQMAMDKAKAEQARSGQPAKRPTAAEEKAAAVVESARLPAISR